MKRNLLLSLFTMFAFTFTSAQQLSVVDTLLELTGELNAEIYNDMQMTNNTGNSLNIKWVRTLVEWPNGWDNYFCTVPGACGFPHTDSLEFTLMPSSTGQLQAHFFPNDIDGCAIVQIDLVNTANETILETVIYKVQVGDCSFTNTNEIDQAQVQLFPNPATNVIQLQNGSIVDQIVIYNILGRQVKYFDTQDSNYYIGDLSKGIYLVKMIDEDSNSVKTLKLRKN